jgi:hypothetical protein
MILTCFIDLEQYSGLSKMYSRHIGSVVPTTAEPCVFTNICVNLSNIIRIGTISLKFSTTGPSGMG